ncbi:MAG: thioredoxin [Ilumatobacteraceae bacterium]|nr:MAG: thioredoxin [Actinomycetota bacterium]
MGTAVNLTAETFNDTIERDGIVLVDFWAAWCGPCRAFAPVFEEVAQANPDIVFGKVDTEAEQELASTLSIRSIPTLMIFRDQVLLYAQPGALPKHMLEDLVEKARALDMDEVRRQIAEQTAAQQPA